MTTIKQAATDFEDKSETKCNILVEKYLLGDEAKKRLWTESDYQYQASIDFNGSLSSIGIKGCPLGRSTKSKEDAISDLVSRVKMESGIEITIGKIRERD
jgi:hypothetical protein